MEDDDFVAFVEGRTDDFAPFEVPVERQSLDFSLGLLEALEWVSNAAGIRSVTQGDTKAVRDPRVDLGQVGQPGISAFRNGVRARTEIDSEYHLRV